MKFSTKSRYALRLMIDLAKHVEDGFVSLKDVSARQGISIKYLEQIITPLSRAGLIASSRGPKGGHRLSRPPSQDTPGDIMRAVEHSLAPVACLRQKTNTCPRAAGCETLAFWTGLYKTMGDYLDSVTLEQLASPDCPDGAESL